ncbi:F-box protein [Actinidia chinensis var. chinensis]|uniref:F-box protein n=1 Tax=Actinidia chinensis var. chinensis TaxID=1590841 RepID=A0A2R6S287_ACTCC|nr:F-box protein [Actinidia chinensis var. chinensis]
MPSSSLSRKSSSSLSPKASSEMVDSTFPPDLIFNILSRLPVKELCKLKSVSKQWLRMITDSYFIHTHCIRSLQNPNLLLLRQYVNNDEKTQRKKTHVEVVSMGFDGNFNFEFKIDVNDAIDLLPSKWDLICFAGENGFYVCNPSTQEFVELPEASCCSSREVNAGMGYVSSRNEYVLIHLFDRSLHLDVDCDIGCEILRFTDGGCVDNCCWKMVDADCPYVVRGWGVLVENAFYWMIWDAYDHPGYDAILSFDLEKEDFVTVSPPEGCFDPSAAWSLVELRGLLCLIDSASRPSTMDIWVLKDYKKHEWVKEYSFNLNGYGIELQKFIIPLDQWDGEILMDIKQESLDFYNLEDKSFKRIDNLIAGGWTWLRLYTESFFSLGSR